MTQPGDLLDGRYHLDRRIGQGGMGEVWVATDQRLNRQVAVKTVATVAPDGEATSVDLARFQREAHATAGISHPNVVTVFDSGIDGRTAYLVMEYLSGQDLATRLANHGPMPVPDALRAGAAIAAGLAAAHAAGVIHRDIKPGNVMHDAQGTVKVVDFGIAALGHGGGTTAMTAAGMVMGSAPFLSPEQAEGYPATARSDLYSLGCCLMAMLTGEPPFIGEHPLALLRSHMDEAPPLVSDRRPEVTREVDDLVDQLLAKDPRDRPASAAEVADRLTSLAGAVAAGTTRGPRVPGDTTLLPSPKPGGRPGATAAQRTVRGVTPGPGTTRPVPTNGTPGGTRPVTAPTRRPAQPVGPLGRPVGDDPDYAAPATAVAPRKRRSGVFLPLVVGILFLAVAGGILLMMLNGKDEDTPPPAPSTTSATTTTRAASTTSRTTPPPPPPVVPSSTPVETPTTPAVETPTLTEDPVPTTPTQPSPSSTPTTEPVVTTPELPTVSPPVPSPTAAVTTPATPPTTPPAP